ncbi:MAG TPA: NADH-quinone oxidoreductase subunit L [Chloroflexota bacterium]|nr:NADH-quinone oxidoreductase subunit L [Chloroflexota bacterium]
MGAFLEMLSLPAAARTVEIPLWSWIVAGKLSVPFSLLLDPLSILMVLVVTGVGFLIHVYATGYMHGDTDYARFFALMNIFVLAMLMLVMAGNFLLLVVGWGGVGFASYALISFWFQKPANAAAGTKAFVMNSIGDVGMLLATFLIFINFGRVDFTGVFSQASQKLAVNSPVATAIVLLLLIGAAAKSAQLPLHTWLPDAMAGPTPVSALIHAATMVTAGVYLIARTHPLYQLSPTAMSVVAIIGAVSALFAATIGLVQPNIKRVLAYSTISQLGYMFLAVGVGAFTAGMFHLVTHAFFKALLFMAAGGVIHALAGEEDLNKMGGLWKKVPSMYIGFLVGALALAGFPMLSGFFSKDEIIFAAFASQQGSPILGAIALAVVALTGFYVFRAFFLCFHGTSRVDPEVAHHIHKPGLSMVAPVGVLTVLAALGGYVNFIGGSGALDRFLAPVFERYTHPVAMAEGAEAIQEPLMLISVLMGLSGIFVAYLMYVRYPKSAARVGSWYPGLYKLFLNKWYVDELYGFLFLRSGRWLGELLSGPIDWAITDGLVRGTARCVQWCSLGFRRMETGFVRDYALAILLGATVVLFYLIQMGGVR